MTEMLHEITSAKDGVVTFAPRPEMLVRCAHKEMRDVVSIVPFSKNENVHSDQQIELLARIMAYQGVRNPITVSTRSGFIVSGHGRLLAAKLNGWKRFPVDLQDFEDEAQEAAARVADNAIQELAELDRSMVDALTLTMPEGFDLELLGIPGLELAEVSFGEPAKEPEPEKFVPNIIAVPQIIHGDCLEELKKLDADSVDALVTDPPYGIRFMGKAWDAPDIESSNQRNAETKPPRTDGRTVPKDSISMFAGNYDLSPEAMQKFQEWSRAWAIEVYRVLKPGGHLLSFASPRTYHRMATGIEEAGFEVRDQIQWLFASGFSKSLAIRKAAIKAGLACGCNEIPEHNMRSLPETDLPEALDAADKREEVLQHGLSEQNLHEPGTQGRADVSGKQSLLARGELRGTGEGLSPDSDAGASPSPEERLRSGTHFSSGENARETAEEKRSGASPKSQSLGQSTKESKSLSKSQRALGGTPYERCPNCSKAILPEGLGSALKPANEPVLLARKKLSEPTLIANVLKWGTGALNIDASRIGSSGARTNSNGRRSMYGGNSLLESKTHNDKSVEHNYGRFPANLILSHSPGCVEVGTKRVKGTGATRNADFKATRKDTTGFGFYGESTRGESVHGGFANDDGTETIPAWECEESCAVRLLDLQSGKLKSGSKPGHRGKATFPGLKSNEIVNAYGDSGGASRFFKTFEATRFAYVFKSSRRERNAGCEGLQAKQSPSAMCSGSVQKAGEGKRLDGKPLAVNFNGHPTVKPLALCRYLINLICPPGGLVLDPFLGSGSIGVAAAQCGMRFLGIEKEAEYVAIASHRFTHELNETDEDYEDENTELEPDSEGELTDEKDPPHA